MTNHQLQYATPGSLREIGRICTMNAICNAE